MSPSRPRRKLRTPKPSLPSLAIVERSFRGSVEGQYAHILWLSHIIREMGGRHTVLLRGHAVLCAVAGQRRCALTIGRTVVQALPDYEAVIPAMLADDLPVFVYEPDCRRLGVAPEALVPGVRRVDLDGLVALYTDHHHIWYW